VIDKSITLRGESNESTVITDTVEITTDNVKVCKFRIANVEGYSIESYSDYNTIENNIISGITLHYYYGYGTGLYSDGDFNTIQGNTIIDAIQDESYSTITGIRSDGDFNTIQGNTITDIQQDASDSNIIGIESYGDFNIIKENTITDLILDGYYGEIIGISSYHNSNIIEKNVISDIDAEFGNPIGIQCWNNRYNIEENMITNINSGAGLALGIYLIFSHNSTIKGNMIDKSNTGIQLSGVYHSPGLSYSPNDNITICENKIFNCRIGWGSKYYGGIRIIDTIYSNITHNHFNGNTVDAYFEFNHILSEGEPYEMNEIPENFDESMINSNIWNQNYWNRPRVLPKVIMGNLKIFENLTAYITDDYLYKVPLTNTDSNPLLNQYDISQNSQPSSKPSASTSILTNPTSNQNQSINLFSYFLMLQSLE